MKDPVLMAPVTIRYTGIFDMDNLYRLIVNWFKKQHYEIKETIFKDKPYSSVGHEIEIEWENFVKIDAYFRYHIEPKIHTYESVIVQVDKNGKKVKMYKGKIQIQIDSFIEIDYNAKFGEKGITGSMGRLLFKHVLKNDILLRHEQTLYDQTYNLTNSIKKFLNFEAE